MSRLSCVTRSSSTVPVKRKSVSSRWTRSTLARPDFNGIKALPLHRLPPTILSAVSKSLASRLTKKFDTLERSKHCQVVERKGTNPRSKERPVVNLSNSPLSKENLDPKYHDLVNSSLSFGHLAEIIRHRKGSKAASFTAALASNFKLAHLAYRLCESASPNTLAKIGTQDVSHLCGNRTCFRPDHLVVETKKKNAAREKCFEEERRGGGKAPTNCSHKPACIFTTWRRHTFTLEIPIRSGRRHISAPTRVQQPLPVRVTPPLEKNDKPACKSCRQKNFYLDIPPL